MESSSLFNRKFTTKNTKITGEMQKISAYRFVSSVRFVVIIAKFELSGQPNK